MPSDPPRTGDPALGPPKSLLHPQPLHSDRAVFSLEDAPGRRTPQRGLRFRGPWFASSAQRGEEPRAPTPSRVLYWSCLSGATWRPFLSAGER